MSGAPAVPGYVAPPNYAGMVPQVGSAVDWTQQALAANNALPADLQVTGNVLPDEQRQRYEQGYLQQYVNPQIAQLQTGLYGQGRENSSFGGAQLGAAQAQGAYQGMMAGEQLYQNRLNQLLARRQSFYGNEGQMAQTSNLQNVQRGMGLANLAQRGNESQNQFNMNAYEAGLAGQGQQFNQMMDLNRFNQGVRQQGIDNAYRQNQLNQQNTGNAWRLGAGAASALAPVIGRGLGGMFGGGNPGINPSGAGGGPFFVPPTSGTSGWGLSPPGWAIGSAAPQSLYGNKT